VAGRQFLTLREPSQLKAQFDSQAARFYFSIVGARGLAYSIESSPDLETWSSVGLVTNQSSTGTWTNDQSLAASAKFFRATELP
jgi:hypothetical protein